MSVASEHVGLFMCLGVAFGGITLSRGIEVAVVRKAHGAPVLASLTATQDALGSLSGPVLLLTGQPHALGAAAGSSQMLCVPREPPNTFAVGGPLFSSCPSCGQSMACQARQCHHRTLPHPAWFCLTSSCFLAGSHRETPSCWENLVHPWNRKNGSPALDCGQTSSRPPLPTRGGFTFEL